MSTTDDKAPAHCGGRLPFSGGPLMTPDDPLVRLILAEAARLEADPRHAGQSPLGWTAMLNGATERMYQFTSAADPEVQLANLAEVRATAIRGAALAVVVARLAERGRQA